ncbi:SMP-30/gluconolactonase/LRE family protein [Jiella sonneratiae]|uniref:SMP-30/gluconolactonase/LRE family protein n=1 Tax=Jiella sonneratiae TaxID=2816856 RepID=A0ABS3J221_9HYPH|nr:SMP-30/gluconolactonase/LRE family protein [Jiella sonneratiae]MBO0903724.1 SMP-30/gluconolactonase/LRE family protein [Jiella sonneratiae]
MWQPSSRYPDPAIRVLDDRFAPCVVRHAAIERLATGLRWAEGPVWFGDGRYLLWSDIPNDRVLRWDEESGQVSVFRRGGFENGHTRDRQGRLVSCSHGGRCVTRTEYDGSITVLADRFDGRPLNSPNDVVVKSDDSIWFSDPTFGIVSHYEGGRAAAELPTNVYRLDVATGALSVVAEGIRQPNGLCFSPDESRLYLVESGAATKRIHVFDVAPDGRRLGEARLFVDAGPDGAPDGFRCDREGNLWAGWGTGEGLDGVRIFAPDGDLIGQIALPERCANLCFGGRRRTRLFMAASQSLYALHVNAEGCQLG